MLAIGLILLFFYGFFPAYGTVEGVPLAKWIWLACNSQNDFIHGRAVPVIFVVMCFLSWKHARQEAIKPSALGMAGVVIGVGLFIFSVRTLQPRLAIIGLPFLILGGLMYLFGPRVTRHFIFPACIWLFAFPIPGIQQATSLLQIAVTKACYEGGTALGMSLIVEGNKISSVGPDAWDFNIAEGCSGIRSLMALAMIGAIYANYTQKSLWKKVFLFACTLPLSLIGNFGRIFTILLLAHFGFEDFAAKTYHDWAGLLLFFPIALSGLFVIDWLLNIRSRGRRRLVRRTTRTTPSDQVSGIATTNNPAPAEP
jgi:exosortase